MRFRSRCLKKEERECLEKMQQGDEKSRNMLIEHNLRLVAHIVKKFENTKEDSEDLISIVHRPNQSQAQKVIRRGKGHQTRNLCGSLY